MKNKNLKLSIASLIISFILGQGVVFFIGAWVFINKEYRLAAVFQVYVSIFSFSQQFADIGSTNRILPLVRQGDHEAVRSALIGKAIAASLFTLIVGVGVLHFSLSSANIWIVSLNLLISGWFYGLSTYGLLERKERYLFISAVQTTPWLLLSATFVSLRLVDIEYYETLIYFMMSISSVVVYFLSRACGGFEVGKSIVSTKSLINSLQSIMPYIGGQIAGQIWGRAMLVIIIGSVSPAVFSAFGPARQMHIGVILLFSIILRSVVRGASSCELLFELKAIKSILIISGILSILAALISISEIFIKKDFYEFIYWTPIFISVLPVIYSQVKQFQIHAVCSTSYVTKIEVKVFLTNVIIFLVAGKFSPSWAMGFSESSPSIFWFRASKEVV